MLVLGIAFMISKNMLTLALTDQSLIDYYDYHNPSWDARVSFWCIKP